MPTLQDYPPRSIDGAPDADNLLSVEEDLVDLGATLEIFEADLGVLFGCHQQWDNVVNRLEGRDRGSEVELREAFERDEVNLTQLLHDVQQKVNAWKKQRAVLEKLRRRFERKVEDAERAEERDVRAAAAAARRDARPSLVKLPPMSLPNYDGSILGFQEWWDLYTGSIDNNADLDDRQKFGYLRTYLTGRASKAIAGIQETAANYATAKKILQEEFGDKTLLKDVLYMELETLKRPDDKVASLREFKQDVERICRQLENAGENLQHENILGILQRKLPHSVVDDYVKKRKTKDTWTTKDLREFLAGAVEDKDAAARVLGSGLEVSSGKGSKPKPPKPGDHATVYSPSGAFAAATTKKRPKPECWLCGKDHLTINCTTYPDVQSRRDRASEASLCYRCLQAGHARRKCTSTRNCRHCRRDSHHSCLCPDMLPGDKRTTPATRHRPDRDRSGSNMPSDDRRKPSMPTSHPERRDHRVTTKDTTAALNYDELYDIPHPNQPNTASDQQRPKSPAWITGSSLTAFPVDIAEDSGSSSLLTVDTTVQNTCQPHKKRTTTVFLDTGSQKNFCTTKLVRQLGLQRTGSRQFRLNTLACKAPQEMTLDRYLLNLPLKDGTNLTIVVYALPHLVGKITVVQARPIGEQRPDGHRWMTRVNDVEPQVLIGNHVYWQLRLAEIDCMKDGTRIIDSSLGTLATRELGELRTSKLSCDQRLSFLNAGSR